MKKSIRNRLNLYFIIALLLAMNIVHNITNQQPGVFDMAIGMIIGYCLPLILDKIFTFKEPDDYNYSSLPIIALCMIWFLSSALLASEEISALITGYVLSGIGIVLVFYEYIELIAYLEIEPKETSNHE